MEASKARAEHRLAALYAVAACTAAIGLICTAVVFGYWHFTLDVCEGHPAQQKRHCGCLLFANSSYRLFMGGDTTVCHFVEYSCVPPLVVGLCMAFLHWYRASFVITRTPKPKRRGRRIVANSNPNHQQVDLMRPKVMVEEASTASLLWWLAAVVLSGVLALLTVVAALTMTVGVAHACQQYRENLIESLAADGYLASLLTERLSCQAVFDFMDFLQPIKERHSANFINSGVALHFAIFAMWIGAAAWLAAALASLFEALRARSCCSCCTPSNRAHAIVASNAN